MRYPQLLCILYLFICLSCRPGTHANQYNVSGRITGLKGSKIYIQTRTDSGMSWIDSSLIENESFELTGTIDEPCSINLFFTNLAGKNEPLCNSFYLENRRITLSGDIRQRANIRLTGALENEIRKKIDAATGYPARYIELRNLFYRAEVRNQPLPMDSVDSWQLTLKMLEKAHNESIRRAVKENAGSYAALHTILQNVSIFTTDELKALSPLFSNLQPGPSYQKLMAIIDLKPDVSTGHAFRDFTLSDSLGRTYSLSSFPGKWLLIDFWASWCGPCRKQIPALKQLYTNRKTDGLTVVSISIDRNIGDWKSALQQEQMPWTNLLTPNEDWAEKNYLITAIPSNILLDSTRKIVAKDISITEIENILRNSKVQSR